MSALEWEDSLRPDHARPAIRESFGEVREQSSELAVVLRTSPTTPVAALPGLRRSLAALLQVLAARHAPPA